MEITKIYSTKDTQQWVCIVADGKAVQMVDAATRKLVNNYKYKFYLDYDFASASYAYPNTNLTCTYYQPESGTVRRFIIYDVSTVAQTRSISNTTGYFAGFFGTSRTDKTFAVIICNVNDNTVSDVDEGNYIVAYTDSAGNYTQTTLTKTTVAGHVCYITDYLDIDLDKEVTIQKSSEPVSTFTIDNQIENSTAEYEVTASDTYKITVNCADGYTFKNPVITYIDDSGDSSTANLIVNGNTATITVVTYTDSVKLTGTVIEDKKTLEITNNIANTTVTYNVNGEFFDIVCTGISDGTFGSPKIGFTDTNGDYVQYDMVVSGNTATYSLSVGAADACDLTGTFTPTKETFTISYTLTNCVIDGEKPYTITAGDTLSVTLKANTNAKLTSVYGGYTDENGDANTFDGKITSDNNTALLTFDFPENCTTPFVIGNAEIIEPVGANYGAINVYKVTLVELDAFSKIRFFKTTDTTSEGTTVEQIDLGTYVNRIKRLYINVPVKGTDVIKCGNYNTGVECEAPDTDTVTLNFGSITVPTPNGDATDYLSEIQLFVPFKGYVNLPVKYVGKTITLTYTINVITGGGVAKVLCGDDVVLMLDVEPNEDILYRTTLNDLVTIGGDTWNEEYLYGIEPYLYMMYYNSLNKDARNNDYENAKLGDLSGFCVVDDVTLSTTAEMTADEQETIISLLKNGVYIEA